MPAEADPIIGNWYRHLDKGQCFFVVAVDMGTKTVDVQHFDGEVEEIDLAVWYQMDIEVCDAPENWSGPLDIDNLDDLGTQITDTRASDWNEPLDEFGGKKDNLPEE